MDKLISLGDADGPSREEYRDMLADLELERRCPPMTDAEIDAVAALAGF